MNEFSCINYFISYELPNKTTKKEKEKEVVITSWEQYNRVCFADYFRTIRENDKKYDSVIKLNLISDLKFIKDKHLSSNILFNRSDIIKHIELVRKNLIDFEYNLSHKKIISINSNGNYYGYLVEFSFKELTRLQIKYVLTWVRYLMEYPYNIYLHDAYKMKELGEQTKNETIENLFLVTANSFKYEFGSGHCILIPGRGELLTTENLKKRLENKSIGELNSIYPIDKQVRFIDRIEKIPRCLEDVVSNDKILERIELYSSNYLKLIKSTLKDKK